MRNFRSLIIFAVALSFFGSFPAVAGEKDDLREGGLTGTGIVGEITDLGSIIVQGHRITFEPSLTTQSALGDKPADQLLPGDVVAVALKRQAQAWHAEEISEIYPLVGPIEAVSKDTIAVLGVEVSLQTEAKTARVGNWIAVSGFWENERVIATRIQEIAPLEHAIVQGSFAKPDGNASVSVGGIALPNLAVEHAREGDVLRVSIDIAGEQWRVISIDHGLFSTPVALVLAEGYFSDVAPSGHYTISGSGLSSYLEIQGRDMTSERVSLCGIDGQLLDGDSDLGNASELLNALGC